ncbi:uncharacterized protein LOC122577215 isoform X2 [Bombus pyrosoma]|uniref:uncharacterized protein LOC122577215 isoform X2 n=1 Tax=Bombus pyrosoma TaxID=396416 RepID=UPI001CB8A8FF|nr:uncharacterized protein LOC122577215 isoform X2 [Bombus pyrosoma]
MDHNVERADEFRDRWTRRGMWTEPRKRLDTMQAQRDICRRSRVTHKRHGMWIRRVCVVDSWIDAGRRHRGVETNSIKRGGVASGLERGKSGIVTPADSGVSDRLHGDLQTVS